MEYCIEFSMKKKFWKLQDTVRTSPKMTFLKGRCRWFQLFFVNFQLFYFLSRIIPEKNRKYFYWWNIEKDAFIYFLVLSWSIYYPNLTFTDVPWFTDFFNIAYTKCLACVIRSVPQNIHLLYFGWGCSN